MVYYYEGINIARCKQRSVINQKGTHGYLLNDLTQHVLLPLILMDIIVMMEHLVVIMIHML